MTDNTTVQGKFRSAWRRVLWPALATLVCLAILLNLGFWQLDRLAWKDDLIAKVAADVNKPPVPAPDPQNWAAADAAAYDYLHVKLTGHFESGAALYYTSLTKPNGHFDGPGYMVYAPFQTEGGWVVMVNRGFVPQGLSEADMSAILQPPSGSVGLTGLLRLSEKPNWTTPAPNPDTRIWFARDTDAMADALGIPPARLAPYSIDLDAGFTPASGLPQAGETVVRFKNDHLGYALTWFGLAATLLGVFLTYALAILRPSREGT
ncbi:SURF1 family protein [Roseibium sp. RKSG952]|uniref:SURF1 family protein n=1 Tax=Roseibium sp. RKSG952 TaxID=2529384 RepID=UPI001AD8BFFA|nr:SURF1 family protein [Roseibium sp. RKSG952]